MHIPTIQNLDMILVNAASDLINMT